MLFTTHFHVGDLINKQKYKTENKYYATSIDWIVKVSVHRKIKVFGCKGWHQRKDKVASKAFYKNTDISGNKFILTFTTNFGKSLQKSVF